MLNRRTFGMSSALAATLAALPFAQGKASDQPAAPINVAPRGDIGRLRRLPKQEQEAKIDFLAGMGAWVGGDMAKAAEARSEELLAKAGVPDDRPVSIEAAIALFGGDPVIGLRNAMWQSVHTYCNEVTVGAYESNAEAYLAELETHDNIGPGSLTLHPEMDIPEYTRHEIHQQTGGYVGNAFSGYLYHADTNQFYRHMNDQDQRHASYIASLPLPADGKVNRILDMGCGIGQLAVAAKDRFPDAEVHGIDIAAPMLRYGHMHAVNLGSDVHFTQALAEQTGFPDGYFDVVVSYIMFHEVTEKAAKEIIREASRILRPGGVFFPIDFHGNMKTPYGIYSAWWDHRWNDEHWRLEWAKVDLDSELQGAGFELKDHIESGFRIALTAGVKKA